MGYKISLGGWRSVFAVPSELVDRHLKTAGAIQLKVLLYLLRHGGEEVTTEALSRTLGYPLCDIEDAVSYWVGQGLLCESGGALAPAGAPPAVPQPVVSPVDHQITNDHLNQNEAPAKNRRERIRYSYGECVDILRDDPELRHMLTAVEAILGKQLNHTEVAAFVTMHHWYGMPSECVAVITERCKATGKSSVAYIEATVAAWAEEDINTLELVHQKIERLEKQRTAWNAVRNALDLPERSPTAKETLCCDRWVNEYGTAPGMIRLAYERCVDKKGKLSVSYMDGIIKNWMAKGIATPEQAAEDRPPERKNPGKPTGTFEATYDKNEIESILDDEWLN